MRPSIIVTLLIVVTSFTACSKKYPRANYLSPMNRDDIGFIDHDTWQQISYGNFFPESEPLVLRNTYIEYPMSEEYSFEDVKLYNANLKRRKPQGKNSYSVEELLKTDLDNIPHEAIPLDQVDPDLHKIAELKRAIFDKACSHARLLSLYNWLINATKSDANPITPETLSALNARYFPPQPIYFAGTEEAIAMLEPMLHKKGFRYEVISERQAQEGYFRCKMVLHYKMKDLILKDKKLRQMTQVHD